MQRVAGAPDSRPESLTDPSGHWGIGFAKVPPILVVLVAFIPVQSARGLARDGAGGRGSGILTLPYVDLRPDGAVQPEGDQPLPSPEEAAKAEKEAEVGPEIIPEPSLLEQLFSGWTGEVRFGSDLSSGNSDRIRFLGGFNVNKPYGGHKTSLRTDYAFARDNNGESENRVTSSATQDWATGKTKFSGVFLRAILEFDQFRDFDYRISLSGGGRYQITKDDKTDALLRFGISATREFGVGDDRWVPEGAFFLSATHILNAKSKVSANVDYFPEIEQPSRYRVNARASWDYMLDEESGLSLRFGAENRYDPRPNRKNERNDFDLRAELIWQF